MTRAWGESRENDTGYGHRAWTRGKCRGQEHRTRTRYMGMGQGHGKLAREKCTWQEHVVKPDRQTDCQTEAAT